MSKKRTSTEASNEEQTNEGSDSGFQQEDNTKRAKHASLSDTTLQDLPLEVLECILVKAVAMEVKGMKLAKSVWKEKADLVISRLRAVCPQWSSILTTNFFRNELNRTLNRTAQETIRLEILHESIVNCFVIKVTTLKDDIVMFCQQFDKDNTTGAFSFSFNIKVHDRNNTAEVKDVIPLPENLRQWDIAACNVSNCLYVVDVSEERHCSSILRIKRDEEQKFNIHPCISDLRCLISCISVSVEGNLIIISTPEGLVDSKAVSVYSPNGFLQHEEMLSPGIDGFREVTGVFQKSNGNLVLKSVGEQSRIVLTEIDTNGIIERQYKSSLDVWSGVNFADTSGRILIYNPEFGIELLDSEFNPLAFTGPHPNLDGISIFYSLHYIRERNEVVGICASGLGNSVLTIFRLREE